MGLISLICFYALHFFLFLISSFYDTSRWLCFVIVENVPISLLDLELKKICSFRVTGGLSEW